MENHYCDSPQWQKYLQLMKDRPYSFAPSEVYEIITDPVVVEDFVKKTGKQLGLVYDSPYHLLLVDLVRDQRGNIFAYERAMHAEDGSAVVMVPVWEDRFILLKQFRHPTRREQYAFPRGFGEPGLTAAENVDKEIFEELGTHVLQKQFLGRIFPDSGFLADVVNIYFCRVEQPQVLKGSEGIEDLVLLRRAEMNAWIAEGKIDDSFSLTAWALYTNQK